MDHSTSTVLSSNILFMRSKRVTWRLSDWSCRAGTKWRTCLYSIQYSSEITKHRFRIIPSYTATFIFKCKKIHVREQINKKARGNLDMDAGTRLRICTTWRGQRGRQQRGFFKSVKIWLETVVSLWNYANHYDKPLFIFSK